MLVGGKAKRKLAFGIHTILSGAVSLSFQHFYNSRNDYTNVYFCRFNADVRMSV